MSHCTPYFIARPRVEPPVNRREFFSLIEKGSLGRAP